MEQIETKTVRELIAELQKLDQDKPIWQIYDGFFVWPANVEVVDEHAAECASSDGVKEGDMLSSVDNLALDEMKCRCRRRLF